MRWMTEVQAWMYLAERWAQARSNKNGWRAIVFSGSVEGLCSSICRLRALNMLTPDVMKTMLVKVRRDGPPPVDAYGYRWPRTIRGARSRAAFCRKMVRVVQAAAHGEEVKL